MVESLITYTTAVICVFGIASGQILFKLSALSLKKTGSFFDPETVIRLLCAFVLYGVMTIAWVWVLQRIELGRIYPIMALAFVLVPLGSHFILGEQLHLQYFIGIGLILIGIAIVVRS